MNHRALAVTALLIAIVIASVVPAGAGVLKGRVSDAKSGESLAGVNVLLQGTLRGTSTNVNGEFVLERVRAGTWSLVFSLIGYQSETRTGIRLGENDSAALEVRMTPASLQTQPVIVTASRREQAIQESPVSVSVLDAAAISYRNAVTVDNALRYIPGVNMTEFQVNVRGSSGYSRGAGSRVLLLVDGIPFLTGDTGELNYESIPVGQVERIEVVKGASSALYGSSALGGVINVITKPVPDETETRVRTYGGLYNGPSFSQWDWGGGPRTLEGLSLSHSEKVGDLGMTLFGSQAWDAGYRQGDYTHRFNGAVKLHYDLSSFDALTTTFNILDQRRGNFLYWKDLDNALVPTDAQQGQTVQSRRFYVTAAYNHTASSEFLYTVRAMWFRNHFTDNIGAGGDDSRSDVLRGEVQGTWMPVASHILTFGAEGSYDHVDANLFGRHSGNGEALYAQDEVQLPGRLRLTLGLRYDIQEVDSLGTNSQVNPKAALVFSAAPGTAVRASFGRGFRAPSVAEAFTSTQVSLIRIMPNPSLEPEHSNAYELGLNQILGDAAVLDVALFRNDYFNLIESGLDSLLVGRFSNVTRARIQGLEATAQVGVFERGLLLNVGYTYVNPRDLTTDDVLKYRPRHILYIGALGRTGVVSAGIDFRYLSRVERIDEQFAMIIRDADERVPISVTDLRFSADFTPLGFPLTVSANVNNIFQYNYVELIGQMAPPRTYVLAIEAKL